MFRRSEVIQLLSSPKKIISRYGSKKIKKAAA